jgi:hypothetical protein
MSQKKYEFPLEIPVDLLYEMAWRAGELARSSSIKLTSDSPLRVNKEGVLVYQVGTLYLDRALHLSCPGNKKQGKSACGNVDLSIDEMGLRNVVKVPTRATLDVDNVKRRIREYSVRDQPMCGKCRKLKPAKKSKTP